MQGVIVDTATSGGEDGGCQQMIKVNDNGRNEDYVNFYPLFSVEEKSNDSWDNKVKTIVYDKFEIHVDGR